ncbi:glutaredoxin family protein [Nocardia sp. NPDC001965]
MICIYTQPSCGPCGQVKRLFEDSWLVERVDYEIIDVSENHEAAEFVKDQLGFRSVPVVYAPDYDLVIHEFREGLLLQLINDVELDKSLDEFAAETDDGYWLH